MTDPASVLRRELDVLIQTQITIFNQARPLTDVELADFRACSQKIRALFKVMDLSKPLPAKPIRKRKIASRYPSV